MTDAVGGVRVYAEEANSASGNGGTAIKKGWNDLDGEQALGFVRERYELSEGDISRGRRQLAFVKALLLKATQPGDDHQPAGDRPVHRRGDEEPRRRQGPVDRHDEGLRPRAARHPRLRRRVRHRAVLRLRHRPERPAASTSSTSRGWRCSARPCAPTRWTTTSTCSSRPEPVRPASLDALELRRDVRLERLPHGRHVHDPHEVGVARTRTSGEPRCTPWRPGCASRRRCAARPWPARRCPAYISTKPVGWVSSSSTLVPSDDAGTGRQKPELGGERAHLVAVVVEEPGPRLPPQEAPAVVAADDLLTEALATRSSGSRRGRPRPRCRRARRAGRDPRGGRCRA